MTDTQPSSKKAWVTPVSIIIAGAFIGLALFFKPTADTGNQQASVASSPESVTTELVKKAQKFDISKKDFTVCLDSDAVKKNVADEMAEAQSAGASGTPFLVFEFGPAGKPTKKLVVPGSIPEELILQIATTQKLPDGIPAQALPNYRPADVTDRIQGSLDAPVRIVEYSDIDCPYCKQIHPRLQSVVDKNTSIAWVYRHFPLENLHPNAELKARATECVAQLKDNDSFWKYLNELVTG